MQLQPKKASIKEASVHVIFDTVFIYVKFEYCWLI